MDSDALPLALLFSTASAALLSLAWRLGASAALPRGARPPLLERAALLELLAASARNAEEARVRVGGGGVAVGENGA